jgi:hypothetical protein
MNAEINPAAPQHLPWFITAPGESDGLFTAMIIFLIVVLLLIGVLYFKLHALPEHIAHGRNKAQMEIVAILAVISLFTHEHLYWIIGLLLAFIQLPDFSTPINTMAQALQRIARGGRREVTEVVVVPEASSPVIAEATGAEIKPTESGPAHGLQDVSRA